MVIAIIGVLASIVTISSLEAGKQSRDEKRQADIRSLQGAVELYKNKYGRYPVGCNGADNWSGQVGTDFACGGSDGQYIVGLAPEFISVLPLDPKPGSGEYGYAYVTNSNGSVYKIISMNSVESGPVTDAHKFASCDIHNENIGTGDIEQAGWCFEEGVCQDSNSRFQTSYAVWGGFAPLSGGYSSLGEIPTLNQKKSAVSATTDIICK